MNPLHIFAVARREFVARARTKAFILSTIGIPALLLLALVVPTFFAAQGAEARRTILVNDDTGVLLAPLTPKLEEAGFTVLDADVEAIPADSLEERLEQGQLGGELLLGEGTLAMGTMTYRGREGPGTIREFGLRRAVVSAVLEVRLAGRPDAEEIQALLDGGEFNLELVGGSLEDEEARDRARIISTVGVFFMYLILILYGQVVMRAVLEEKRDRIVEIIVSSIRPGELMMGKILGVGAVGLAQLLIWLGSGVLMFLLILPSIVAMSPEVAEVQDALAEVPFLRDAGLLIAFFVLGYFLFAALYAAAGAMCSSDEEVQQAQMPVTMLIIIPFILLIATMEGPERPILTALSMFPFFSPIMMYARAAGGAAPAWQVGVALGLLVLTIPLVAWVAGRIYRVGILMQGKRPTLPELIRWVKEA
jgi:ABC-2 type transport system permease protein